MTMTTTIIIITTKGIASNMLLARLATRIAKPRGQYQVDRPDIFIREFKARDLPGVGWKTAQGLSELGVQSCSELQGVTRNRLQAVFGPTIGAFLYNACRGVDEKLLEVTLVTLFILNLFAGFFIYLYIN